MKDMDYIKQNLPFALKELAKVNLELELDGCVTSDFSEAERVLDEIISCVFRLIKDKDSAKELSEVWEKTDRDVRSKVAKIL